MCSCRYFIFISHRSAITLRPLTAEVHNIDHVVTVKSSAVEHDTESSGLNVTADWCVNYVPAVNVNCSFSDDYFVRGEDSRKGQVILMC